MMREKTANIPKTEQQFHEFSAQQLLDILELEIMKNILIKKTNVQVAFTSCIFHFCAARIGVTKRPMGIGKGKGKRKGKEKRNGK